MQCLLLVKLVMVYIASSKILRAYIVLFHQKVGCHWIVGWFIVCVCVCVWGGGGGGVSLFRLNI